ncbi:MAG: cell division protein FtsQ/DivIB [Nitriliruptoraceae bacterium]
MTIDDRIAARRASVREDRRRARLRRTVWALVVLGVVGALVLVERSSLVALAEVQVQGTERLQEEEVRAASGLELGTSTLRLALDAAAEEIERELPLVQRAEARRLDPLTVELVVVERTPVLVAEGQGTRRYLDREGVVIDEVAADEDPHLPVIELPAPPPAVGSHAADDATLENAVAAWRGLSGSLRAEVRRYQAAGPDELTLTLGSGVDVRLGRAVRMDEKVRALGAVLADVGDTPVAMIDVRAPSAPVVVAP